jgi:hypothetical protein
MNCPNCGLQTLQDQKFCRSCGAGLQMTTRRLAAPAAVSELEVTPAIGLRGGRQQRGNAWTLWAFAVMFLGVALGVIGKMAMHNDMVTVVGVLISLAGMFLTAYPYVAPSSRRKHNSIQSSRPEVLRPSPPTSYLPPESSIEYVPSITERTTGLLKNSEAKGSGQKKDSESQT